MKATIRVAAVQLCASTDKRANLAAVETLVRKAAAGGAELIVLPELFNLYGNLRKAAAEAESLEGETATLLKRLAQESNAWLIGGSFAEVGRDGKAFNTSLAIDPAGEVRGSYRKMHLFDVDLGETLRVKESDNLLPGQDIGYVETPLANVGLSICYDLRFPELYRQQSRRGAELLCIPAAFTQKTGRDHWHLLVRARAVENQCYAIAANQVGEHAPGSVSYGHSLIVDPWGRVLAEGSDGEPGVITAELSAEVLNDVRRKLPALQHRIL
ncbi:carbon-nitrogen hydrolase family protein [Anatilimnocola floriformis]|uniref:carbon-nitrogen hydrolase family protein n=1 Tax=Anatilimnocola floriformis TaxID=2948575 RepID=UPI0020C24AB9|nr:carbon-nitrogen hydrolase family protein [Anatilimnocola floriformis]